MQRRSRTQYMFRNTLFRTQRNRIKPIGDQQVAANAGWGTIGGSTEDEQFSGWARLIGFTNTATLTIQVEPSQGLSLDEGGYLLFNESPTGEFINATRAIEIAVSSFDPKETTVTVTPGNYYLFTAFAVFPVGINVTILNKFGGTVVAVMPIAIE